MNICIQNEQRYNIRRNIKVANTAHAMPTVRAEFNDQYLKRKRNQPLHLPSSEQIDLSTFIDSVKKHTGRETIFIGMIYDEELARANLSLKALAIVPSANDVSQYLTSSRLCIIRCLQ